MSNKEWNNAFEGQLPPIDDEHEEGEIMYLGAFYDEDPNDICTDDEPWSDNDLCYDIVYYYGNGKWKNNRWEKVWVKYWMEIPSLL